MQKKIFVSLLLGGPLALPAMANVSMESDAPLTPSKWQGANLSGTQYDVNDADGSVSCGVGVGAINQTVTLPKGKYVLTFGSAENVKVTANGQDATGGKPFTVAAKGEVKITIEAAVDNMTYKFTNAVIELDFDLPAAIAALNADMAGISLSDVVADDDRQQAAALRTQKGELENEIDALQQHINVVANAPENLNTYEEYGFDNTPSTIKSNVDALAAKADAYNDAVDAENTAWANFLTNTAALATLNSEAATLQANIDALLAKIKAGSQYVQDGALAAANALNAKIASYKTDITAAYADMYVKVKFDNKAADLQGEIDTLTADYNVLKADSDAYEKIYAANTGMLAKLTALESNTEANIRAFQGVEGMLTVYNQLKKQWIPEISNLYKVGVAKPGVNNTGSGNGVGIDDLTMKEGEIKGAAAILAANEDIINATTAAINNAFNGFKALVDTQNGNWQTADRELQEAAGSLAGVHDVIVPDSYKAAYAEMYGAVNDRLEALRKLVNDEYTAHDLAADDYTAELDAINEAIGDLEKYVEKFVPINDLQKALDAAKEKIRTEAAPLDGVVDIYGKFSATFDAIQNAILTLDPKDSTFDQGVTDIRESITNGLLATADKLIEAFTAANGAVNDFSTAISDLRTEVEVKLLVAGAVIDKTHFLNTTVKGFEKKEADFRTERTRVALLAAQECYDGAVALLKEITEYNWQKQVEDAAVKFAQDGTAANNTAAQTLLAKVREAASAVEGLPGASKISFEKSEKAYAGAADSISKADALVADVAKAVEAYAKADTALDKAMNTVGDVQKIIDGIKANKAAYDELVALETEIQAAINELIEFNINNTVEPAASYYNNLIQGEGESSLSSRLYAASAKVSTAYNEVKAVTDKATLEATLKAIGTATENLEKEITANEAAHKEQVIKGEELVKRIDAAIDNVDNNNTEFISDAAAAAAWKEAMKELRERVLVVNRDVNDAYGQGKSVAENDALLERYNQYAGEFDQIMDNYLTEYAKKVVELNNKTVAAAGWDAAVQAVKDAYAAGVNRYNDYRFQIKNKGYKAYLENVLGNYEDLFKTTEDLNNLIAEKEKLVADDNAALILIVKEEFKKEFIDKAYEMVADVEVQVSEMETSIQTEAKAYYALLQRNVAETYDGAEQTMTEAGFKETIIKNTLSVSAGYRATAEMLYNNAVNPENGIDFAIAMNNIADQLDRAISALDAAHMQAASESQWKACYDAAMQTVEEYRTTLDSYRSTADEDVWDENEYLFQTEVNAIFRLNVEVAGVSEGLIDEIKSFTDRLSTMLSQAESYVKVVEDNANGNVEEKNLREEYQNVILPGFEDDYTQLLKYASQLAGGLDASGSIEAYRAALDNLKYYVEESRKLVGNTMVETAYDNTEARLAAAYTAIADYELDYLQQQAWKLRTDFNDAVTNGYLVDITKREALNRAITELNMELTVFVYDADDKEDFRAESIAFEKRICSLIAELQGYYPNQGNTELVQAQRALTHEYNEVYTMYAEAITVLNGYLREVQDKYIDSYRVLRERLESIKTTWEADGSWIIAQQGNIIASMKQVAEELTELNSKSLSLNIRMVANNEAYERLTVEIDDVQKIYDQLLAAEEEAGYYYDLEWIGAEISYWRDDIKSKHEAIELNGDSQLENKAICVETIERVMFEVKKWYYNNRQNFAESSIRETAKVLNGFVVPADQETLSQELDEVRSEINLIVYEITRVNSIVSNFNYSTGYGYEYGWDYTYSYTYEEIVAMFDECISRVNAQLEAAAEILRKANESTYVPGDVDLDPDGKVNTADVQLLIKWVGEGLTWDELYDENPVQAMAADINGTQTLNIADVTADIALAVGVPYDEVVRGRMLAPAASLSNNIGLTLVSEENGVRRYALMLNNAATFVGGQVDFNLPLGMELVGIEAGERAGSHEIFAFDRTEGVRVLIASMNNDAIAGDAGAVLLIDVAGEGELGVTNVIFSDAQARAYELGNADTSMVDAIIDGAKAVKEAVYDAAGRMLNKVQRGINIIRRADGTTTKEMRRK